MVAMSGKELLLSTLKGVKGARAPWVPFVGTHGGSLVGCDAETYLRSADRIVEGLSRAVELYRPDGLPIVFDLQTEAEVLGCQLRWSVDGPPSVVSHPLELGGPMPPFSLDQGRYPLIGEATRRISARFGDQLALYGLVTGPFTLALHLLGNEIFFLMFDEPERVHEVLKGCAEVGAACARFYVENGCHVIALVDPMTSQISTDAFDEFAAPYANQVFDAAHAAGALTSMFVCGNATRNLEAMAATRCDNVSVDENVDLSKLSQVGLSTGKSIGGNLKLTAALLLGTPDDCRKDAVRCFDQAGEAAFVIAPGCDLPFAVPPTNMQAVAELVHDVYARELARKLDSSSDDFDDITLPDYGSLDRVVLDVITLNSETCPPCQYMLVAAEKAAKELNFPVEVREHRITRREGIGVMTKLGVQNLPTICIDGEAAFVSIIPDQTTLQTAIREKAGAAGKV